jgi:hypothetical protein
MDARVYVLRSSSIKKKGEAFSVAATVQPAVHRRRGPYTNLHRATTATARKLQLEFVRRHNRVVQQ